MEAKSGKSAERDYRHLVKPNWNGREREKGGYALFSFLFATDDDDCYPVMMKCTVTRLNDARLREEDEDYDL